MSNMRVYRLAKELGLTNEELVDKLAMIHIAGKNHMSTLTEEEVARVHAELSTREEVTTVKDTRVQPGVIRRRKKVEIIEVPPEERPPAELQRTPEEGEIAAPSLAASDAAAAETQPEGQELAPSSEGIAVVPAFTPLAEQESGVAPLGAPLQQRLEVEHPGVSPAGGPGLSHPTQPDRKSTAAEEGRTPPGVEKGKRVFEGIRKVEPEPEPDLEKDKARKKRPPQGKKVVEYKVKQLGDIDWDQQEEGREVAPRRNLEIRREKRPAKRIPQKPMITVPKLIKRKVRMAESIPVGELAKRLSIKSSEIIKKLMQNGIMATINQTVDRETAALIATEYHYEVESIRQEESQFLPAQSDAPEEKSARPPVVTIMGHVNHGKTRLLDAIRKTHVMESEAGGITQHIGAYTVPVGDQTIVFLDTPGHEAFTKMRARGAKVTDIVVLVVAADDGVMPQTVEAINHAKAAHVPILVAVNKMDLIGANMEKVKQSLAEHGLLPEEWGGETLYAGISAREGTGIQELLEMILLQAEMLEQKANPNRKATGVIIEARLDRTQGPVATVLVQSGTLRVGDPFVTGVCYGKVRALVDDRGGRLDSAGPSIPVEVLGWSGVPEAGDLFYVVEEERKAKLLSLMRLEKVRQVETVSPSKMSLDDLYEKIRQEGVKELNIILKADVQGSIEALSEALSRLNNEEVQLRILHAGVGGVTETDVMLASASDAIILAFNIRAEVKALMLGEQEKVDIRFYTVIYDAVSDLKSAMTGLMKPVYKEVLLGHAEVRETYSISRLGTIAGTHVLDGKIERSCKVRVLRNNSVVYDGKLASLRRFKDDVKEVSAGYECGIRIENFNDVKNGDILESYVMEQVAPQGEATSVERRPSA